MAETGAVLAGVGLGPGAELGEVFDHAVSFPDARAFFDGAFRWLARLVARLAAGSDRASRLC